MYYTIYETRNNVNGKIYVGVHVTENLDDLYLGSGTALFRAIKKYGRENFERKYLHFCDSEEAAFALEREIVDEEFIKRSDTYNLKIGGHGGWNEWNKSDEAKKARVKAGIAAGEYNKVRNPIQSKKLSWREAVRNANAKRRGKSIGDWTKTHSIEDQIEIRKKISESSIGVSNSQHGTHVYVDPLLESLPPANILNKNRYKAGTQPEGWITTTEWRNIRKKRNSAFGRSWYNDGNQNYYLFPTDEKINELSLIKRRLTKN